MCGWSLLARPIPAATLTTLALLPVILATILAWTTGSLPDPIDFNWFGPGGAHLLTGRWGAIYNEPPVQAGPFELLPYGLADLLGVQSSAAWTVVLTTYAAGSAFLTALVLRPRMSEDLRSSALAGAGTLVVSLTGGISAWTLGHPAEVLVPLLWIVASRMAMRGRPAAAALLVAASAGFEVWGILGAPVVLLAARPRLVRSGLAGLAGLGVVWLPFVVAGPFTMFAFTWPVSDASLLHLIQPDATSFPWVLRLLQALGSLGAGTAVALLLRRRNVTWRTGGVTIAVVAARLVFDPVLAGYYWTPVVIGAVGALVLALHRRDLVAVCLAALMVVLTSALGAPVLRAAVLVVLVIAAATLAHRQTGQSRGLRAPSLTQRAATSDPGMR